MKSAVQKYKILPPQRLIQSQIGNYPSTLGLIGFGGDQDARR
jgi:hypothetical protein